MVYCNSMLENTLPVGISQVIACLKKAGHEVRLFDTTFYKWDKISYDEARINGLQVRPCEITYLTSDIHADFADTIRSEEPDILGLSISEYTLPLAIQLLEKAKPLIKACAVKTVIGGVHAIIAPETITPWSHLFDVICIGEGEDAFPDLCRRMDQEVAIADTPGFWIYEDRQWHRNGHLPLVDLDALPPLDFSEFPLELYAKPIMGRAYRHITVEISRGCVYQCTYCADHLLNEMFRGSGRWFRKKSPQKVLSDMARHVARYDPEYVYIISESFFTMSTQWLREFFDGYKAFGLPFWFNCRPENITEEKMAMAKEAGLSRMTFGIECGNEAYRRTYLNRHMSNDTIMRAAAIVSRFDVPFSVNVMIGLPDETRDMVFETIALCKKVKPDGITTSIFAPYHGLALRELCVDKGYMEEGLLAGNLYEKPCIRNPFLSAGEVEGLFRTLPLYAAFPESEYDRIRQAEADTPEGRTVFEELRRVFYARQKWLDRSAF